MDINLISASSMWGENFLNLNESKNNLTTDQIFQAYLENASNEMNGVPKIEKSEGSFTDLISGMNNQQLSANDLMKKVITGESEDTHGALIALEQATTRMEKAVKIREELTRAYDKLINIQI